MIATALYLAAIAGLSLAGLVRAALALGAIVLGYLVFGYAEVVRPLPAGPAALVAATGVLAIRHAYRPFRIAPAHRALFGWCAAFLAWAVLLHAALGQLPAPLQIILGRVAVGMVIMALVTLVCVTRAASITFARIVLLVLAVSAAVGIGQYFIGEPFWMIRSALGPLLDPGVRGGRASGLANFSIDLSYQLTAFAPLAIALAVDARRRRTADRNLMAAIAAVLVLAILVGNTRSALLGLLVSMVVLFGWRFAFVVGAVAVAALAVATAVLAAAGGPLSFRYLVFTDRSTMLRLPALLYAVQIFVRNPLGTGLAGYVPALQTSIDVDVSLPTALDALDITSHNQLVNLAVLYGAPGLALALGIYLTFYAKLRRAWNASTGEREVWLRGTLGCAVAYFVNSMFHNNGPLMGDIAGWLLMGLGASLTAFGDPATPGDDAGASVPAPESAT